MQITSRQLSQDAGSAKKAAKHGPVFITDRGRPAHVLLTIEAYEELLGGGVIERLGEPAGIEEIDLTIPPFDELPRPASFD